MASLEEESVPLPSEEGEESIVIRNQTIREIRAQARETTAEQVLKQRQQSLDTTKIRGRNRENIPFRSFSLRERPESHKKLPKDSESLTLSMALATPEVSSNIASNHSFPDLLEMATGHDNKLPRTLSTSALRIKTRSPFWEKFWGCHQAQMGVKM